MSERSRTQRDRPLPHERYDRDNRNQPDAHERELRDGFEHAPHHAAHSYESPRRFSDNDAQYQSGYATSQGNHHSRNDGRRHYRDEGQNESNHNRQHDRGIERPRQDQQYRESHVPLQENAIEQDIWLREKQPRITFNNADLADVAFIKRDNGVTTLTSYAGIAAMLALVGLLAFSSLPELSALDIIEMDGYAGEQPTKTPFNLASLRDCEAGTECAEFKKTTVTPVTTGTRSQLPQQTTTFAPEITINAAANRDDEPSGIDNTSTTTEYVDLQEIPAATSTPATIEFRPLATDAQINDRLVVLQQWSNVRGTPDIYGDILTALATGKTVTKIGQSGQWIEVRVDEKPALTGYMHRSTVAPQQR